jgi:uncharacterized integral membrane protein
MKHHSHHHINLSSLLLQGVLYRIHVIVVQSILFFFLTGKWSWSIGVSLLCSAVNTILYVNFHYWYFKFCHLHLEKEKKDE